MRATILMFTASLALGLASTGCGEDPAALIILPFQENNMQLPSGTTHKLSVRLSEEPASETIVDIDNRHTEFLKVELNGQVADKLTFPAPVAPKDTRQVEVQGLKSSNSATLELTFTIRDSGESRSWKVTVVDAT